MIDFDIDDLHFRASAQHSTQSLKKLGSHCCKMQIASSLVKCVIWESVYQRCGSCNSFQTPGALVLPKVTPQLYRNQLQKHWGSSLGYREDRQRKWSYWWVPQGLICSLCCNTGPFPLAFVFSMGLSHQRSTFLLIPLLLAFNEECWVNFPLES